MTTTDTHLAPTVRRRRGRRPRARRAKHAAMWASGDYPTRGRRGRRRLGDGPGRHASTCSRGSASSTSPPAPAPRPSRPRGAVRTSRRPTSRRGCSTSGGRARAGRGADADLGGRRRRGAALRGRRRSTWCCPASASCSRRTTRPPPTSSSASAGPAARIGVLSWTPGGLHRPAVRDHEAVRPAAPARGLAGAAVGPGDHVRALLGDRVDRPGGAAADAAGRPLRHGGRVPRLHEGDLRADHRRLPLRSPTTPTKVAALDADLAALGERFLADGAMEWEYLLVTARRV